MANSYIYTAIPYLSNGPTTPNLYELYLIKIDPSNGNRM